MNKKLELHYFIENDLHSMDAFVKNKAEADVLKVLKEISNLLDLKFVFDVEALKEGGVREFFKIDFARKSRKNNKLLNVELFCNIASKAITYQLNADEKNTRLEKEAIKNQIQNHKENLYFDEDNILLNQDTVTEIVKLIAQNDKVKLYKSAFYKNVIAEKRITKLSFTGLNENGEVISDEQFLERELFAGFILDKIEVAPLTENNINIEILSPVLGGGEMKWRGIYNAKAINFNLLDKDFKKAVSNREYSFTSGTAITCDIELVRTMDKNGEIRITKANVTNVSKIFHNDKVITIKQSKPKKAMNQLSLF